MGNRNEYLDFFARFPKYNGYVDNTTFEEIYYWLGKPEQVYEMIAICKYSRAAIEGVAKDLEKEFGDTTDLNIREDFIKQMIGTAVKHVLEYFGYVTTIQKTFLKASGAQWFKSGMHYKFDENAPRTKEMVWEPMILYLD